MWLSGGRALKAEEQYANTLRWECAGSVQRAARSLSCWNEVGRGGFRVDMVRGRSRAGLQGTEAHGEDFGFTLRVMGATREFQTEEQNSPPL